MSYGPQGFDTNRVAAGRSLSPAHTKPTEDAAAALDADPAV
jgi:hypothetical protein